MLSKIQTVRRSVHKIKSYLKKHHLQFVFFNSKCWGVSTHDSVSHETIFEQLDEVTCSGTTDFSCIIPTIEHHVGEDTISIIISDGYHTTLNDNKHTLQNVKDKLFHKFNYAIGIGSDFDNDLLSTISEQIINSSNRNYNIFDFLFISNPKTTKIPSDTFFVCNTHYTVHSDICTEKTHDDLSDISYLPHSSCKEYALVDTGENIDKKKTYLFVLDVSGSMDDSFLYSNNNHANIHNNDDIDPYLFSKFTDDTMIEIPYLPHIGFNLLLEDTGKTDDNPDISKFLGGSTLWSAADEVFLTCKAIYELQYIQTRADRLSLFYKLAFEKQYHDSHVLTFVQHTYNKCLTENEKKFNVLLHTPIHEIRNITNNQDTEPIKNFNRKCKICFQKDSDIVLSCLHSVSCFDCTLGMIKNHHLQCPICRDTTLWARQLYFRTRDSETDDVRACLRCKVNLSDVFFNPCNHIFFCNRCSISNVVKCQICSLAIQSTHRIMQS